MAQEFRKREKEEEELIERYEESLRKNNADFYDVEHYEIIIDHYMALSKFKKALVAVNSAITQFPFSTTLLAIKAQVLVHMKHYTEALLLLEMAKNLHPNDVEVYLTIGSVQSLRGKHEEAIKVYEEALSFADENKDELFYNIGLSYQSMEDYDEAIAYYKKSIEVNLAHEGSLYELAFCLDIIGQLENSLTYYKKFIDEDPYSTAAWYNLGIVYDKLERFAEAIEAYEYALAIDENFASARFNMGNTLMNLERFDEALNEFKKTIELEGPSPEVYCCIGTAYEGLGDFNLGLKYFQKSIKLDSLFDEAIFGAGKCLEKQEKWYQALHFFNKAIKLSAEDAEYWKAAAHAEYKIGNIILSLADYEEANRLDPEDKEIWLNWSFVFFEQGEYQKAIDVLLHGIEEIPNESDFLYRIAAYLIESGKFKEAHHYLENALLLNFDGHLVLFDFFLKPETQKALYKIIDQYRKEKP